MTQLLDGIRVLDWTVFLNGAGAGYMLGELGAEVIHIEKPVTGDSVRGATAMYGTTVVLPGGVNVMFEIPNRNKKSITLDLSKEKGREVLYRLIGKSDVFLTNFHHSIARKLKVDYETVRAHNPKIVYCTASGYGSKGPDAEKRAFDPLAQARSGFMFALGDRDQEEPLQAMGGMMDQLGSTIACLGILAALLGRELHGFGQEISTSLLGSAIHLQVPNITTALLRQREFSRHSRKRSRNPLSNMYRCADGKWIILAEPQSDRFWSSFCGAMGIQHIENDPKFADAKARSDNCEELNAMLDEVFATRPREEWVRRLTEKGGGLAFDIINKAGDLANDPQVIANDYIVDYNHEILGPIKLPGFPVQFSETPARIKSRAPEFGEHTEEVLIEVGGYSWEEIAQLREEEII